MTSTPGNASARDQHGVVTRAQLLARGFTDHGIQAHVDAGRWQRLHEGVYVTYSGPPTQQARRIGALLACRGGAILSHETAGELTDSWRPTTSGRST